MVFLALWDHLDAFLTVYSQAVSGEVEPSISPEPPALSTGSGFAILGLFTIAPLLFIWYRVREFRHFVNHTTLGGTRFISSLRADIIMGIVFLAYCMLAVFVGTIAGFVMSFGAVFATLANPIVVGLVGGVIFLLLAMTVSPLVWIVFARFALVEAFCKTLEIQGTEHLDTIVQSSAAVPARGEGLADAFDVGAI